MLHGFANADGLHLLSTEAAQTAAPEHGFG